MAVFESLIQMMIDTGAYYLFIWLVFAGLIYALLENNDLFEEDSVSAGISLGSSFFVLAGIFVFAPEGLFLNFAAALGFSIFAIFGLIIALGLSGVNVSELGDDDGVGPVASATGILILISFFGALVYNLDWGSLNLGVGNRAWEEIVFPIAFLIFLIIVLDSMTSSSEE